MRNLIHCAAAFALAIALSGCANFGTDLASFGVGTLTSMSTAGPSDLKTYIVATQAADLATLTMDVTAVNARALGLHKPVLQKLYALNEALHSAWLDLKAAHDAGQALDFGAIQAAWDAYNTFRVQQAIPEAPMPPQDKTTS